MNVSIMRLAEITEKTGVSKATIYRWSKDGRFPKPIKYGARCTGWLSTEVAEFLNEKAASRD